MRGKNNQTIKLCTQHDIILLQVPLPLKKYGVLATTTATVTKT